MTNEERYLLILRKIYDESNKMYMEPLLITDEELIQSRGLIIENINDLCIDYLTNEELHPDTYDTYDE